MTFRKVLGSLAISGFFIFSGVAEAKPYKDAELYSVQEQLYGRISVRMRMAKGSGLLSTFFLYKNGSEQAGAFWEEVDVEVLGKNDAKVWQSNIISGQPKKTSEELHENAFSLADDYHTYTVEWSPDSVRWLFDGNEVRHTEGGQASDLTKAEGIRFNIWAAFAEAWVGPFDDTVLPQYQFVNWVEYYRYDAGQFVLDWRDDFDSLDTARWAKADWTFAENRVDFVPENAIVQDGTLVLALTKEGQTGFSGTVPVDSGITEPPVIGAGGSNGTGAAGSASGSTSSASGGVLLGGTSGSDPLAGSGDPNVNAGCGCHLGTANSGRGSSGVSVVLGALFVVVRRVLRRRAVRN